MNFKLLKNRDFFLLVFGKFISMIGTYFQSFALSLYVLKITGSGTKFASVLAMAVIPQLILGPIAGVFVDWFDRKKIIVGLDILSGTIVGIMAFIFISTGRLPLAYIYILVTTLSCISVVFNPAAQSVIPSIMKEEELLAANSLNSFALSGAQLIAPLLAGIVYGLFGLMPVLVINSLSFISSGISEMFIRIPKLKRENKDNSIKGFTMDFKIGIEFIKEKKLILKIMICAFFINFAIGPIGSVGMAIISKQVLKVSDIQYGILETILAGATLLGPITAGIASKKLELKEIFFFGILVCGIVLFGCSFVITPMYLKLFSTNLVPFITLIVIQIPLMIAAITINISVATMMQKEVPTNMLGRVGAVLGTVSMAAMPLGQIIFGSMFDLISSYYPVMIAATIIILTALYFRLSTKKIETIQLSESILD